MPVPNVAGREIRMPTTSPAGSSTSAQSRRKWSPAAEHRNHTRKHRRRKSAISALRIISAIAGAGSSCCGKKRAGHGDNHCRSATRSPARCRSRAADQSEWPAPPPGPRAAPARGHVSASAVAMYSASVRRALSGAAGHPRTNAGGWRGRDACMPNQLFEPYREAGAQQPGPVCELFPAARIILAAACTASSGAARTAPRPWCHPAPLQFAASCRPAVRNCATRSPIELSTGIRLST